MLMNRRIQKDCESSCDYVLPDYMGDIRKVLTARAKCMPSPSFADDTGVSVGGSVEYEIIYADSENKLTAINTSSDYEFKSAVADASGAELIDSGRVSNLSVRITGPRKVSLRSVVNVSVTVSCEGGANIEGDGLGEGDNVERITRELEDMRVRRYSSGEREYAEQAERLRGVKSDEVEIIVSGGSVRISETEPVEGGVRIKGELIITALVRTPDEAVLMIRRAIPFEETVSTEGVGEGAFFTADGVVTSAAIGVNDDGEECVLVANAIAEFYVSAYSNEKVELTLDAYLPEFDSRCEYDEFSATSITACQNFELEIKEKYEREAIGLSDVSEVLCMACEVRSYSFERDEDGMRLVGEIAVSGIACEKNVDGSRSYMPIKMQVPFSENVNVSCQIGDGDRVDVNMDAVECTLLFDEGEALLKCTAAISLLVKREERVRALSLFERGEKLEDCCGYKITVYYPTCGEGLFDVAKKFHTTRARLALDNSLAEEALSSSDSPDSLLGVKRLIIK